MSLRSSLLALMVLLAPAMACSKQERLAAPRFFHVDVFVDAGSEPLAAWQLEVRDTAGLALLVSVEGGEHAAFAEPARHDPRALRHDRVVLAAYHLGPGYPTGRTRVATLHFAQERAGDPQLQAHLVTAAAPDGHILEARVEIES